MSFLFFSPEKVRKPPFPRRAVLQCGLTDHCQIDELLSAMGQTAKSPSVARWADLIRQSNAIRDAGRSPHEPNETLSSESPAFSEVQAYPNPFNPTATIGFRIPGEHTVPVRITVHDVLGRQVAVLLNEAKSPGRHQVVFHGDHLASGVYLYRISAGKSTVTGRMLLLK